MKRFKWSAAIAAGLLSLSAGANAQIFIPIYFPAAPMTAKGLLYGANSNELTRNPLNDETYIPWSENAIDFDKLKGIRRNWETMTYRVSYYAAPVVKKEVVNGVKYKYLENKTYYSTTESWVNKSIATPVALKICQTNFDAWELNMRKAMMDFCSNKDVYLDDIYSAYSNEYKRMSNAIDDETGYGKDSVRVEEIADSVRQAISQLKFDPEKAVANLHEGWGYQFSVGAGTHIPFSDYVSSGYGLDMTLGFSNNRQAFGLGAQMEFGGECKRPFNTSKGEIAKGESLNSGSLNMFYGYQALRSKSVNLTPYMNIGGRFYDHTENDKYSDNRISKSKSGLSLGIGMMTDLVIKRTVDMKASSIFDITSTVSAIRLKPFFAMTNYSGELGWVPSFNISVEWSLYYAKLK